MEYHYRIVYNKSYSQLSVRVFIFPIYHLIFSVMQKKSPSRLTSCETDFDQIDVTCREHGVIVTLWEIRQKYGILIHAIWNILKTINNSHDMEAKSKS